MEHSALLMAVACTLAASSAFAQDTSDKGAEAKYFTPVAPGVVKDKRTGLQWMRCSLWQDWSEKAQTCKGSVNIYTWQDALELVKKFNALGGYAGSTNWRLPTVRELQSLRYCSTRFESKTIDLQDGGRAVRSSCAGDPTKPTLPQTVFPGTPHNGSEVTFWSSSTYDGAVPFAWHVSFYNGYVDFYARDNEHSVRLVR